jgi:hypothetical protein
MDGLKQLQLAAGEESGFMLLSSVLLSNLHKVTKVNYQFSYIDGRDLAKWFERLTAKVKVATQSPGFNPSNLRHSGIWGVGDDTVLNEVHGTPKIFPFSRLISVLWSGI